jgi:hypothetical protein
MSSPSRAFSDHLILQYVLCFTICLSNVPFINFLALTTISHCFSVSPIGVLGFGSISSSLSSPSMLLDIIQAPTMLIFVGKKCEVCLSVYPTTAASLPAEKQKTQL